MITWVAQHAARQSGVLQYNACKGGRIVATIVRVHRKDWENDLPAGWHVIWADGEVSVYSTLADAKTAVEIEATKA